MISITLKNLALRSAQKEGYIKRTFNNMKTFFNDCTEFIPFFVQKIERKDTDNQIAMLFLSEGIIISHEILIKYCARIDNESRKVLFLYVKGYDINEICHLLNTSPDNVIISVYNSIECIKMQN